MPVKKSGDKDWKERVRMHVRRSKGVVALVSKDSLSSSGQKWELQCAEEEKKPLCGFWVYTDDRTMLEGINTVVGTWNNIAAFIDSL